MQTTFEFFNSHVLFDIGTMEQVKSFVLGPIGTLFGLRSRYIKSMLEAACVEPERNLVMSNRWPNRNSVKGVAAYGQLINSGTFHEFDYYKEANLLEYGSE